MNPFLEGTKPHIAFSLLPEEFKEIFYTSTTEEIAAIMTKQVESLTKEELELDFLAVLILMSRSITTGMDQKESFSNNSIVNTLFLLATVYSLKGIETETEPTLNN